jgi:all-trans-retinol 13,14-reductase
MKYDYVVIGAGVSGMSTAIILAKSGFDVALVEKSRKTAPLIRGFTRNGIYFDTGFHYTGSYAKDEILDVFFRYLGLADQLQRVPYDPEGFDIFRSSKSGFEFRFPYGYDRIRQKFYETFPAEKSTVDTYLQAVKETYNSFPYISLNEGATPAGMQNRVHGQSLKEFLDRLTDNRTLKLILSLHCLLHGVPSDEIPFVNHACIVGPYYESVHGISGGGRSIAKAFEVQLKKLGVDVYCGHGVSKIRLSSDNTPAGVRLEDGQKLDCNGCVATVHPSKFLDLIPDPLFRPAYRKRLKRLEETGSANILYAGCNSPPEQLGRANILVSPDLNITGLRQTGPLENRPLFISCARPKVAASAKHGITAICPASGSQTNRWSDSMTGKRPSDYTDYKEELTEKLCQYIGTVCPELIEKISFTECATALTLRDYSHSPFGSLYGVKHKVGQYNPLPLTKAKGLFLAGQAIAAPGILGAVVSAFLVCGIIIGHYRVLKELKKLR